MSGRWQLSTQEMELGTKCSMKQSSGEVFIALRDGDTELMERLTTGIVQLSKERGFEAVFFETPMLCLDRAFEFVIMNASDTTLVKAIPDYSVFEEKCASAAPGTLVVEFPNLGGDAKLVVPCRRNKDDNFTHLLLFLSSAPLEHIQEFWKAAGAAAIERAKSSTSTWISTSGLGVSWLHLRFDTKPKYYTYVKYTATE
eukprot:TRINITY_DN12497_c0_g1_i1.p1 TRINITY_DN12497_c0_g1~~TRINITY_DN12497_c0_g1_i1.p1  ORF type:complete len:199 (+),score=31.45 TRINITY_DN12497_c0_g1_i1:208-804(+)